MRALSGDPSAPAPSEQLTLLAPSEGTPVRAPDAEPAARRLKLVPEHVQLAGERVEGVKDIELADEEAELTAEQERAVARRREPLLLSAGAGSGKTRVLVERFVAAVLEDQLAPSKILAITFTERAAGELRERIRARFLQLGRREAAHELERAFVGTFHGFCARMLRAHAWRAGLEGDFAILDEGSARWLRGRAFEQAMRELVAGGRAEAVELLAAYGPERARSIVSSLYAALRSRGQGRVKRRGQGPWSTTSATSAATARSMRRRGGRALCSTSCSTASGAPTSSSSASVEHSTSMTSSCAPADCWSEALTCARRGRSASSC